MTKIWVVILMMLFFPASAMADVCGDRIARLQREVQGLALDQRAHVTKEFDAFYLAKSGSAERVMVSCGPNVLTVDADWDNGTPPPAYQDLMRGIGHALNLADDQFGTTVDKCVKRAAVEDDDDDEDGRVIMETAWAELTCGNDQGRTRVTIAKPR